MTITLQSLSHQIDEIKSITKSVYNVDDLSILTGWSRHYIYKLTSQGKIPFYKPNGKSLFFNKEEIESWLLRNRNKTQEEMQQIADTFINNKRAAI